MDWTIFGTALAAVAVLFLWSEYRLQNIPKAREEFSRYRSAVYLLVAGVFLIVGAAGVAALNSGLLRLLTVTYLMGGQLLLGCVFLLAVLVRVALESRERFKKTQATL